MKKTIEQNAQTLIDMIRQYSRDQKELWQQVPYLALQADGRSGYSDNYSRAYRTGYWALESSIVKGYYNIFVDLSNGDLVNAIDESQFADAEQIIKVAFHLEEIDACEIIDDLTAKAKSLPWKGYAKSAQDRWRKDLIKELDLKKRYTLRENYQRKIRR
jgi:hypothetical protein